jgi:hypothetical protein
MTALQELITYMEENFYLTDESREKFVEALEKDKQQIIEAFNSGQAKEASECFWTKGNYYYQNKYGQHTNGNI